MERVVSVLSMLAILLAAGLPAQGQGTLSPFPKQLRAASKCNITSPAKPVARSVRVTVPVPAMAPCAPARSCPGVRPAPIQPGPVPVRVDIAVRPEGCNPIRSVPVVYRDPGFVGPIISHSVGLAGAALAAPFRLLEMFAPVDSPPASMPRRCGPPPRGMNCGTPPPAFCRPVPPCPVPPARMAHALCRPQLACAPPGPSVAPLPSCARPPCCGPDLPPAIVREDPEPFCAPQSLIGGLLSLPSTLIERGRLLGDMGAETPQPTQYPR